MNTTNKFKELIKYATASMFVKPYEKGGYYCPFNLMLIAPPECGKTRLLGGILCKKAYETMDLSPKIIKEKIIPDIERGEINYLIISDLIQLVGHKKITSQATIRFLNAIIEEGVKDSDFFGLEFHLKKRIHCGLISGLTLDEFFGNINEWNKIGFLHRTLPVTYDYSKEKINEIHQVIASGKLFADINEIALSRKKPMRIQIPEKYSQDILIVMNRVLERFKTFKIKTIRKGSKNIDVYYNVKGFRLHDRLRQLARAICFIDSKGKRKIVNSQDINKLMELESLFNFPNTTKYI